MTTRRELWDTIHTAARSRYEAHEARAISAFLCEELFGMRFTDVIVEPQAPCPTGAAARAAQIAEELGHARPAQYIAGYATFLGRRFHVCEGVLIPRPETEELVQWILEETVPEVVIQTGDHRPKNSPSGASSGTSVRILDIGTGSGCIAVSLAAERPDAEVTALDISEDALAIASENARSNGVRIHPLQCDILQPLPPAFTPGTFDLIVSNPPYVTDSEKRQMQPNVLQHEPALALFVRDDDPLLFYRTIARHGRTLLRPGGRLYFEINEQFGDAMLDMLREERYSDSELRRDAFGKARMVGSWLK